MFNFDDELITELISSFGELNGKKLRDTIEEELEFYWNDKLAHTKHNKRAETILCRKEGTVVRMQCTTHFIASCYCRRGKMADMCWDKLKVMAQAADIDSRKRFLLVDKDENKIAIYIEPKYKHGNFEYRLVLCSYLPCDWDEKYMHGKKIYL